MTEFFYALGDFFTATFKVLPPLGNGPNYLIMATIAGLLLYWIAQLVKYQKDPDTE